MRFRVPGFEPDGRGFESLRARHLIKELRRIQKMYYPTIRVMSAVETLAGVLGNYSQYWNSGVKMALSIIWESV